MTTESLSGISLQRHLHARQNLEAQVGMTVASNLAIEPTAEADRLVALLTSGLVGCGLLHELWTEFRSSGRFDVFLGLSSAITKL